MMDLWTLLVENVFGGFWLAVLGMAFIMFVIMAFGSITSFSNLLILAIFIYAMALGYGYPIIIIPVFFMAIYYFVQQLMGYIERIGGN